MSVLEQMSAHKSSTAFALLGLFLVVGIASFSRVKRVSPVSWGWYGTVNAPSGVALGGFDPVLMLSGKTEPGSAEHSLEYKDAEWRFASVETRSIFEAQPEKYAPAFGGFCAFAMGKGFTANGNPEVSSVQNGRLFVFNSEGIRADFLANLETNLAAANAKWLTRN